VGHHVVTGAPLVLAHSLEVALVDLQVLAHLGEALGISTELAFGLGEGEPEPLQVV
jgi:hypothetical protein